MTDRGGSSARAAAARPAAARLVSAHSAAVAATWDATVLGDEIEPVLRLIDQGAAAETVHWGRNYLWRTEIETSSGPLSVVVKQVRHDRARARWRRRHGGSKAEKSWRIAQALCERGLPTPAPIAWIESFDPSGPAWYVSARVEGVEEVRYAFRRWAVGETTEPPVEVVVPALARLARRLHDAGVWHRDYSAGNVLVGPVGPDGEPALWLVDLNRARLLPRVGLPARLRDLARLPAHRPEHRRLLREAYFAPRAVPPLAALLHELFHRGFHGRHAAKRVLRAGIRGRGLVGLVRARTAHPHIPAPPSEATTRDQVVWDHLSDQPHHHASPLAKLGTRLADVGDHALTLATAAFALPRTLARYRRLVAGPREAVMEGIGVAVRPHPADPRALLEAIDELGCHHLLLRLHPWSAVHDEEQQLAAALFERGHELCFALPQDRGLVRDRALWRERIRELARRFGPYGRTFQVGQAINRSKWGVWTLGEYLDLAADAAEILRDEVEEAVVVGPAVIDFEPHVTVAAVNRAREGLRFDALASLLYVDRRGAPEATQLGFDSEGKAALMLAIAESGRRIEARSWITEVNWPLREGPHSPAGRSVSVDQETQADYLVRYYLATLGSGFAERVYWWQLVAKGYGLATPRRDGALERRPAFTALATLVRELGGARRRGVLEGSGGARGLIFETPEGRTVVAGWLAGGARGELELPAAMVRLVDRDGTLLPPIGTTLEVDGSVRYAELETSPALASSI